MVYESLLTHYSDFFRAALKGRFEGAEEKTVKLDKVEPATFRLFVYWLYNRQFPCHEKDDDPQIVNAFYGEGSPDYE